MRDSVWVIGAGMMGSGIAAMAALGGRRAVLTDQSPDLARAGLEKARSCIALRVENGLETAEAGAAAEARLAWAGTMEAAAERAQLVIEAVTEHLPLKQELFAQADALLPAEIPLCSNTSGLQITKIAARCQRPERTMTTHFWLPAHLVPLVEVVMGARTEEARARAVASELRRWGKTPVLVKRDVPGQLANRIFQAMIREAVAIVASGLASAEDVDTAIRCGMAVRFPEWGPLMHLDAIGLELGLSVQDSVLPDLCREAAGSDYLRQLVDQGKTGAKEGQGFYDWRARSLEEAMAKRDACIIDVVKTMRRLEQT